MNDVVIVLLPAVSFTDPECDLLKAFGAVQTTLAISFWARFAARVGSRTNLLENFDSVGQLLDEDEGLPSWRTRQPKQHMLCAFLVLLTELEQSNEHEATSEATRLLAELRTRAQELFSRDSLSTTSFAELQQLSNEAHMLKQIQAVLEPRGTVWESLINYQLKR